jgi:carbon-monoxide dehydrogenase medium subunit
MKAAPFSYLRAASLADAFKLWSAAGPEAQLLAGGQSLLASLAFRLSEPSALIDISRLPELAGISRAGEVVRVGAGVTLAELGRNDLIRRHVSLLAEAVPLIAHAAIRNRGTVGGSLAFADPAAELPACAVALDAVVIACTSGFLRSAPDEPHLVWRRIPARQFFTGLYATALRPSELIAAVEFPIATADERSTILEVARRSGDYAMAGVAARAKVSGSGLTDPRLVFFGAGDRPVVAERAMAAVAGKQVLAETIAAAQAALGSDLDPPTDQHGGPEMKRHLARVLLARALKRLSAPEEARAA